MQEPARSTIAGFALTGANYEEAVRVLKKRYGKGTAIQQAHVNDLLSLPSVYSDQDTPRLRRLYDRCETHYRGLIALGVNENTYASVVVPAVMQNLPENFRLSITRGTEFLEWSMEQMLEAFLKELELREDHHFAMSSKSQNKRDWNEDRMKGGTVNALFTKQDKENCAFCLGKHNHEDCPTVKDIKQRKSIVVRFARCFKCMKKGHRARECKSKVMCKKCGQGHHISLCEAQVRQQLSSDAQMLSDVNSITTSPSTLHVGTGGRVALQTAPAVIRGEREPRQVRVLFDGGSHRSFITSGAAQRAQLAVIRQDWLGISTFGQRSRDTRLRDVVEVKVSPVGGQKVLKIEAYVVPEISSIQNGHVELARNEYPHLKDLWFSDVCKAQEELEIDILVGADYLWNFQKECTIEKRKDDFFCPICKDVLGIPIETLCSHYPMCKLHLTSESDLTCAPRVFIQLLCQLDVRCKRCNQELQ